MKIKIFKNTDVEEIEKEVNYFMQNRNVVDIKQSIGDFKDDTGNFKNYIVITVLYQENEWDNAKML